MLGTRSQNEDPAAESELVDENICSHSNHLIFKGKRLAGGLGFEPRQAESEFAVLPLDDPPLPGSSEPRNGSPKRGS